MYRRRRGASRERFAFHTSAPPVAPIITSATTTSPITFHLVPVPPGVSVEPLPAVGVFAAGGERNPGNESCGCVSCAGGVKVTGGGEIGIVGGVNGIGGEVIVNPPPAIPLRNCAWHRGQEE